MDQSCRTDKKVMSHRWISHVAQMNESCRTDEWVMSHNWMSHALVRRKKHPVTKVRLVPQMSHTWLIYVCDIRVLMHFLTWLISMRDTCHLCVFHRCPTPWEMVLTLSRKCIRTHMSHKWRSHVTHMYESYHIHEWVISHRYDLLWEMAITWSKRCIMIHMSRKWSCHLKHIA